MENRYIEYDYKVVRCGDFTEIYTYSKTRFKQNENYQQIDDDDIDFYTFYRQNNKEAKTIDISEKVVKNDLSFEKNEEFYTRRLNNVNVTKAKIKRLIYANCNKYKHTDKFLTLTFAPDESFSDNGQPTRDEVVYCFKQFKKRYTRKFGTSFKHIAVIERGTKGTQRLHIHLVAFDLPYIKMEELQEIWQYGTIDIRQATNQEGAVDYILKYVRKTLDGDYIEKGKKFYFTSRGLYQPEVLYLDATQLKKLTDENNIGDMLFSCEQFREYIGKIHYAKYRNTDRFKAKEHTQIFAEETALTNEEKEKAT